MKQSASTSTLLCLLLLAACSTAPVVRTETVVLEPPAPLTTPAKQAQLVPSKTNADIITNSLSRQTALDTVIIKYTCLVDWLAAAKMVALSKGAAVPMPASCGQIVQDTK